MRRRILLPCSAKHAEGIWVTLLRRWLAGPMINFRSLSDSAEFSDDQAVSEFRIVEQHVVLLESGAVLPVVIVGVIPMEILGALTTFLIKQDVLYSLGIPHPDWADSYNDTSFLF